MSEPGRVGYEVSKFEQVSNDGYEMSLAWRGPCQVKSHIQAGRAGARGEGFLSSEVQCIIGNGHMGPP